MRNDGAWKLYLYATTTLAEYEGDRPDYEKATHARTLNCLESATLSVQYNWTGHPARYWWVVLTRNGARVYKSPVVVRP